jgi:tRNA 2-selenouridine synthase
LITQLNIQEFLSQSQGHLTLDVRSEGEYNYGHILHATNLPLFNNEERKVIGTAYKQQGKNEAILLGLDVVGKKMSEFVRFVQPQITDNKVFVHCWRGGMRSGSMALLLNLFGFEVFVLKGGYKAYRQHVLQLIASKFKLIVIGGKTGSGKTDVLQKLKEKGEQIIDLEALANHKGSAFGALGLPPQPSTEHFENMLAEEIKQFDLDKRVWLEDESKSVGRVFLDLNLWNNMRTSPVFIIELPLEIRLQRLVRDYGEQQAEGLEQAITNIKRRLGNEQWKNAIDAVRAKDFAEAAKITLYYYDRAYEKGISLKETKEIYRYAFETGDLEMMAQTLIAGANKKEI